MQIYGSLRDSREVAAMLPQVGCPSCGRLCGSLSMGAPQYPPPSGIKLSGAEAVRMWYVIAPCGCRVDQDTAGGMSQELMARARGATPALPILSEQQRFRMRDALLADLAKISFTTAYASPTLLLHRHYDVAVILDRLFSLGINSNSPIPLAAEIVAWGERLRLPYFVQVATPKAPESVALDSVAVVSPVVGMQPPAITHKRVLKRVGFEAGDSFGSVREP